MDGGEILKAATGPTLGSMMLSVRMETVRANIVRAYGLRGMSAPDPVELESMVREVVSKIDRNYRHITAAELAMVVEAGVSGELGMGVSVTCANIFGWINNYMTSDLRKETLRTSMRNFRPLPPMQQGEDLARKNRDAEVNGAKVLWLEYKTGGALDPFHLDGYVAMVYDGLEERGVLRPNKAAWDMAERKARAEIHRKEGARSVSDGGLRFKTKKHLLLLYFSELLRRGAELPELT